MNCAGFGAAATSRRFQAAWAAFIRPARRPTRGSGLGGRLDGAPWPLPVETATASRPAASKRNLDLIEDSIEGFLRQGVEYYPLTAMTSISTRAARGSPAACTVERAGLWVPKRLAYTSFMAAKSAMSARYTVAFTTFAREEPAATNTASRFRNTCSVCSAAVWPTSSPVLGSSATWPAV